MNYIFTFGRDRDLSLLEIYNFLKANYKFKIIELAKELAIFQIENFNPQRAISCLGSVVKIGRVLANGINAIEKEISKIDVENKRINYAISIYNSKIGDFVKECLKQHFKELKVKAMLKKAKTPSQIIKKKIFPQGLDFIVYKEMLAKTEALFNPKEHIARDIQRPKKDYLKTISIRLAKILINLASIKPGSLMLDPFCGYGTILQEALLMGINCIGLDVDRNSINAASANLKWLKKNYKFNANYKLIIGNARRLSNFVNEKVDAIVTEPYLGPFIRGNLTPKKQESYAKKLIPLYKEFLIEATKILKKNAKIVVILPEFVGNKPIPFNKLSICKFAEIGVKLPIKYGTRQKLKRNIFVLTRKQ